MGRGNRGRLASQHFTRIHTNVGVGGYTYFNVFTTCGSFQKASCGDKSLGFFRCEAALSAPAGVSQCFQLSSGSPGSLQITWQEMMVGIESGLLMFPINILIITIFRSIRPRAVPQNDSSERNVRPFAVTVASVLKVCFTLGVYSLCLSLFSLWLCLPLGHRGADFLDEPKYQEQDVRGAQAGIHR